MDSPARASVVFAPVRPQATLQDIAEAAGVHRSTVSLALRDHPRISQEMRRRIQALAKELGYRTNPLVAALMQSRRSGRAVKHVVLAYVTNYPTRYGWRPPHHDRPDYFPGATERATDLGYKLDHFWLAEPGMTPARFSDILTVRSINGGRLPPGVRTMDLAWDRFSAVALGFTLQTPAVHRVAEDFFASSMLAMEHCIAAGYRRIGLAFTEADDSPRVGDRWIGAYLRQQLRLEPADRLPPFIFGDPATAETRFRAWYREHRPDAVLATHGTPALAWLERLGVSVPGEIGLATLANDHLELGYSGSYCNPAKLGGLAVEMLVGLMRRGEVGIPTDPHEVLLQGEWVAGRTLGTRRAR